MNATAVYVHIPWCRTKCPYCDFNSHAATVWPEARYTEALVAEWHRRRAEPPWQKARLASIFFGGGTPSLFGPSSIGRILEAIGNGDGGIDPEAEITLEANPGTVTLERLRGYRAAGVNRISFGIQSFDPRFLKLLGRLHTLAETREAAPLARAAGFDNVSLDLIFAVPGQTLGDWSSDLQTAISFAPEHVSAYNLTYEEGTPFFDLRAEGRLVPLENDLEAEMFERTRRDLTDAGYRPYEVSNFAIPGRESRHNRAYWRADPYLGLGAGAHSWHPAGDGGRRWANVEDPARYMELTLASGAAVASEETLGLDEAAGEFVFLNLRTMEGFEEARFRARFGRSFRELYPQADDLVADGLLHAREGRIRLTDRGLLFADEIFARFAA